MRLTSKLILAALMATATAPLAAQVATAPAAMIEGTRLDVVARGEVRRVPDLATISAGVVTQALSVVVSNMPAAAPVIDSIPLQSTVVGLELKNKEDIHGIKQKMQQKNFQYQYLNEMPDLYTQLIA